MKSLWRLSVVAGLALCAAACAGPADSETADEPAGSAGSPGSIGYHVINLRSLGGTSAGNSINNLGLIAGTSNLAGDQTMHASLWFFGLQRDLGTLGGPNSAVIWPVKNILGVISGIAETAEMDPLEEDWSCSAFFPTRTGHVCRGFVWERGVMRPLPTLGGTHSFATGTNNFRQTVGWAENTVHDPTCTLPQRLQFRAVVWGPGRDQIRDLPPLPGESTSSATAINDSGQVVGISGSCSNAVGGLSAAHAVMWENGTPTDLGNFGGVAWNTAMAMNQAGDVVGFANLPGTTPPTRFNAQAFLWTRADGIQRLGALADPGRSQALGINSRRQVVGLSCSPCTAFIWQNGVMTDLNTLVVSGDREHLFFAGDINDFGVITGTTNEGSTFLAIPIPRF